MTVGNAILFRMPYGVPGDISRRDNALVEAQPFGATAFASYGIPAVVSSSTVVPVTTTGQVVYGFLVRPFPFQENVWPTNAGFSSTPPTSGAASIMKRGYLIVVVNSGGASAALGSQVYVYTNTNSGSHVKGGIEGTSGANIQKIPAAYFTSPVDANNYAEIFIDTTASLTANS